MAPNNKLHEANTTQYKYKDAKDGYKACKQNVDSSYSKIQEDFNRNVFENQGKGQLRFDNENHDAGVFNEAAYSKKPGSVAETLPPPGNIEGGNREVVEVASGSGDDGGVRITTRARMSYELDRYSKNAMLIINYSSQDDSVILKVKNVFEKYRFEIETINISIRNDFLSKETAITEFFKKDFTNYGALAVFVVQDYWKESDNTTRHEYILKYNFGENLPASLKEKPIIIINEDAGIPPKPRNKYIRDWYPNTSKPNILQFDFPFTYGETQARHRLLLHKFLEKINDLAGDNDLQSVFTEVIRERSMEFINAYGVGPKVLPRIFSTLLKEIRLARSPL